MTIKSLLATAGLAALVAACNPSPQEQQADAIEQQAEQQADAIEQNAEVRADSMENQADAMREGPTTPGTEAQADAMEDRADAVRAQADATAERVEEAGEAKADATRQQNP
jgi:hypothetical protein